MQQQNVYSIPTHQNQLLTGIIEELNQSLQFTNQSQHIRVNTPIQLFNLTSQFTPEGTDQSNHPNFNTLKSWISYSSLRIRISSPELTLPSNCPIYHLNSKLVNKTLPRQQSNPTIPMQHSQELNKLLWFTNPSQHSHLTIQSNLPGHPSPGSPISRATHLPGTLIDPTNFNTAY